MPVTRDVDYLPYLYTCNRCRSCTVTATLPRVPVCPAFQYRGFFAYSGGGKAYAAQGVIERQVPIDADLAEVVFTCQLCGACMALCPPQFDTVSIIRDLRDHVVGKGIFVSQAHRRLIENLRSTGSPWGAGKRTSAQLVPSRAPEDSITGQTLLYAGCANRHTDAGREMFATVRRLLDRARFPYAVLGEAEPACGCLELSFGLKRAFPRIARQTLRKLNRLAPGRIVTTGASCGWAFDKDYIEIGDLEPETVHVTEVVLDLFRHGSLRPSEPAPRLRVTYHDPCALGRGSRITEPPREILSCLPGVDLVEMRRSRVEALCCGAGPGMREINPDFASFTARERAREILATGTDLVVTACSACVESLRAALTEMGSSVPVRDLYSFALERTSSGG